MTIYLFARLVGVGGVVKRVSTFTHKPLAVCWLAWKDQTYLVLSGAQAGTAPGLNRIRVKTKWPGPASEWLWV